MISSIDKRDPVLFTEMASVQKRRIRAKIAFEHLMNEILTRIPLLHDVNNTRVEEMLLFASTCFNETELQEHTVRYFLHHGSQAKLMLDAIEKYRFELRLLEEDLLEDCYEEVAMFLEYLTEVHFKIQDIHNVYQEELYYLQN